MIKRFGKKLVVGVIIGVSMTVVTTFGWFSGSLSLPNIFSTAKLQIEYTDSVEPIAIDFMEGYDALITHAYLEIAIRDSYLQGASKTELDYKFYKWWKQYYTKKLFEPTRRQNNEARESGLAFFEYHFTNKSNVPVYFRISKPVIKLESDPRLEFNTTFVGYSISPNHSTTYNWDFDPKNDKLLLDGNDGYYYSQEPILVGENPNIMFAAYFLGEYVNEIPAEALYLYIKDAEVIQVANNAVFLSPDWQGLFYVHP